MTKKELEKERRRLTDLIDRQTKRIQELEEELRRSNFENETLKTAFEDLKADQRANTRKLRAIS